MEQPVAYCGLACDTCPVHLATHEKDASRRLSLLLAISEQCSALYNKVFLPEDINDCEGCRSAPERLFRGCLDCGIRNCAIKRNLKSCAYCIDFACEMLEAHFALDAPAKERLIAIRVSS